jgi:hypothetical protein
MHQDTFSIHPDLLYHIPAGEHAPDRLRETLAARPEIRFVSLAGIDLAGMTRMKRFRSACFWTT